MVAVLEIERLVGRETDLPTKMKISTGEAPPEGWLPVAWVSQAARGLDKLLEDGMPDQTPLVLSYSTNKRSVRWFWVWKRDLTAFTAHYEPESDTPVLRYGKWSQDIETLRRNCRNSDNEWLAKTRLSWLGRQMPEPFQQTLAEWQHYLNEMLLRYEMNQQKSIWETRRNHVLGHQMALNKELQKLEEAEQRLENLSDPDWLESAFNSWVEQQRYEAERDIKQTEDKAERYEGLLGGMLEGESASRAAYEEAEAAWKEACLDWLKRP